MKIREPGRRIYQFNSVLFILISLYYLSGSSTGLETALSVILFLLGVVSYNQSNIMHLENRVRGLE